MNVGLEKVAFFRSDSAANMAGNKSGAGVQLQLKYGIQPLKCQAHGIMLASKRFMKSFRGVSLEKGLYCNINFYFVVARTLRKVYSIISRSAKNTWILEELQTECNCRPLKVSNASTTRWGDQLSSVLRTVTLYKYLIQTLLDCQTRALGKEKYRISKLLSVIGTKDFVFTCFAILPLFKVIHWINLVCQKEGVDDSEIMGAYKSGRNRIRRCIKREMFEVFFSFFFIMVLLWICCIVYNC
jgi:hypothetical protein